MAMIGKIESSVEDWKEKVNEMKAKENNISRESQGLAPIEEVE